LTNHAARVRGIAAADVESLIDAFDRVLGALEIVPAVDYHAPPTDLFNWVSFGHKAMARRMPTLSFITVRAIADLLHEAGDNPTPEEVEAAGHFWLRHLLENMREELLSAIADRGREGDLAAHATALLTVAEYRIPRMDPRWSEGMIGLLASELGTSAIPVLERIAVSESLDAMVRKEVQSELNALIRKFGGRAVDVGKGHLVDIAPVEECDRCYLGCDGIVRLEEGQHGRMTAFRDKLQRHPRHLEQMRQWRAADPAGRAIRIAIWTDAGWSDVFQTEGLLLEIAESEVPFYVGGRYLSPSTLREIHRAVERKLDGLELELEKLDGLASQMTTLDLAAHFLGIRL